MNEIPRVRSALARGGLVTAANWPVVVVQFIGDATFRMLVAVPIAGGALLVALGLGTDFRELFAGEWRELATVVIDTLRAQPAALGAFLFAFGIVVMGGSALMFTVKAGVVATLVAGERAAGALERPPLRAAAFWRASQFGIERFIDGCAHFFGRYLGLGFALLGVYALSGILFLVVVVAGYRIVGDGVLWIGWTMVAALASALLIAWITLVNLIYLLTQMIIAVDDRPVQAALQRALWFLRQRPVEIAIAFGCILALVGIAMAGSILVTTALGLISFIPLLGFAVLPFQIAAWLLRGFVFQYLGLAALGAYLALYRPVVSETPEGQVKSSEESSASPLMRSA